MCTLLLAAIIAYTFPICLEAFAPSAHSTFTTFRSRAPVSIPKTTDLQSTKGFELSDLFYDDTSTAFDAWEWTSNLGAPAALVAGAVLVTLGETRNRLIPKKSDMQWVRVTKQLTRFLLLTSFAFEVVSIFVSTVTGTVLLSHGKSPSSTAGYGCPLGLLHHHHEFEYLTIELGFLQGLLHWLSAVALELLVPNEGETLSARRMNKFMASLLLSLIFWILAFTNNHFTWYSNYFTMIRRFLFLFFRIFFGQFRPMSVLYGPSSLLSMYFGWRAFNSKADLDDE